MLKLIFKFVAVVVVAAISCLGLGCTAAKPLSSAGMPTVEQLEAMERTAGEGESEIVVNRVSNFVGAAVKIKIFINDRELLLLGNGKSGTVVIPNGRHSIYVKGGALKSSAILFGATGNRIVFQTGFGNGLEIRKYAEIAFDGSKTSSAVASSYGSNVPLSKSAKASLGTNAKGVEKAIKKACADLIKKMPDDSKIAVVHVADNGLGVASLVIDEIEFNLVSTQRFTIVDRSTLNLIQEEQKLQMSGAVNDDEVVQIGALSGANVVIAGSISKSDNSNTFSLKAMDVKTGQIITMARVSY